MDTALILFFSLLSQVSFARVERKICLLWYGIISIDLFGALSGRQRRAEIFIWEERRATTRQQGKRRHTYGNTTSEKNGGRRLAARYTYLFRML